MADPTLDALLEHLAPAGTVRARRMFGGVGLYLEGVFFGLVADGRLFFRVDDESRRDYESAGSEPFQPFPGKASMRTYWEVPERVQADARELKSWTLRALRAARARDAAPKRRGKRGAAKSATERSATSPATGSGTGSGTSLAKSSPKGTTKRETKRATKGVTKRVTNRVTKLLAKSPARSPSTSPSTSPNANAAPRSGRIANLGPVSRRWLQDIGVRTPDDLARRGSVATFLAVRRRGHRATASLLYALEGALLGLRPDHLPDVVRANLRERARL